MRVSERVCLYVCLPTEGRQQQRRRRLRQMESSVSGSPLISLSLSLSHASAHMQTQSSGSGARLQPVFCEGVMPFFPPPLLSSTAPLAYANRSTCDGEMMRRLLLLLCVYVCEGERGDVCWMQE